ncbi:hypothetical protein [Flavobacterium sp.]|uniref:hypothetical protein n=1 Tax=Flavobacterium sp. TaxID=239 RepID=UPI0039E6C86E
MKKLALLVAVFGLATATTFAQDATAKPVKHNKKHKTEAKAEVTKPDAKATKAEATKATDAKAKK